MPFTPESSLVHSQRVTLSRDDKEDDGRPARRIDELPAGYTTCIEKFAAGVTLQLGTGQADETCTYSPRNSDAILYTSYDREGSFYLQSGSVGSRSSRQLLTATFQSSFDKSSITLNLSPYPPNKRMQYKDLLKKKMFQDARTFTYQNRTYKWTARPKDNDWMDNVEFSSSSWKCRSGSFFELKSSFPDKIIATSAELLGTESKSAKCTLYLDDEALAMQDMVISTFALMEHHEVCKHLPWY